MRDFLHELATTAAEDFPQASSSAMVVRRGVLVPVVFSDARAHRLDDVAIRGPLTLAATQQQTLHIPDLTADLRWPDFQRAALAEGVGSMISQPVEIDHSGGPSALLVMYASQPFVFDGAEARERLGRLAGEVGRALSLVTRLSTSERSAWHLEDALSSRGTIDQAIGVVMAQQRCNADAAFAVLTKLSQNRNTKLRTVAAEIVAARAGRGGEPRPV